MPKAFVKTKASAMVAMSELVSPPNFKASTVNKPVVVSATAQAFTKVFGMNKYITNNMMLMDMPCKLNSLGRYKTTIMKLHMATSSAMVAIRCGIFNDCGYLSSR